MKWVNKLLAMGLLTLCFLIVPSMALASNYSNNINDIPLPMRDSYNTQKTWYPYWVYYLNPSGAKRLIISDKKMTIDSSSNSINYNGYFIIYEENGVNILNSSGTGSYTFSQLNNYHIDNIYLGTTLPPEPEPEPPAPEPEPEPEPPAPEPEPEPEPPAPTPNPTPNPIPNPTVNGMLETINGSNIMTVVSPFTGNFSGLLLTIIGIGLAFVAIRFTKELF